MSAAAVATTRHSSQASMWASARSRSLDSTVPSISRWTAPSLRQAPGPGSMVAALDDTPGIVNDLVAGQER